MIWGSWDPERPADCAYGHCQHACTSSEFCMTHEFIVRAEALEGLLEIGSYLRKVAALDVWEREHGRTT